ncbi:MAG TPA: hypothetical protein VG476_02695 [Acidimicrobiales bacterium]|nr:hypothetical protein [Acidimicrobiales bacterium]
MTDDEFRAGLKAAMDSSGFATEWYHGGIDELALVLLRLFPDADDVTVLKGPSIVSVEETGEQRVFPPGTMLIRQQGVIVAAVQAAFAPPQGDLN